MKEALVVLQWSICVDSKSYVCVFLVCGNLKSLRKVMQVHTYMIKTRFESTLFWETKFMLMYVKCRDFSDACKVFDAMPEWNMFPWNSILAGYSQHGIDDDSLEIFGQMQFKNMKPDYFTFSPLLKACMNVSDLVQGKIWAARDLWRFLTTLFPNVTREDVCLLHNYLWEQEPFWRQDSFGCRRRKW